MRNKDRRDALNAIEDQLTDDLEEYLTAALSDKTVLGTPLLEALSHDEAKVLFDSLQHHMGRILEDELDGLSDT